MKDQPVEQREMDLLSARTTALTDLFDLNWYVALKN